MISKDKTYCTRDGREVRIYATDAGGLFPIHGAIFCDGLWIGMKWTCDGHTHFTQNNAHISMDDLAEVKPRIKLTAWMNLYAKGMGTTHTTKEQADRDACANRKACVKLEIDCEEGEGL